jgi:hypothetical protein
MHGCHPSITPTLIDAAKYHRKNQGKCDALLLAASELYGERYADDLERWERFSMVHEEPAVSNDREKSLARRRHRGHCRPKATPKGELRWSEENAARLRHAITQQGDTVALPGIATRCSHGFDPVHHQIL